MEAAWLPAQARSVPEAFGQLSQRDNCHPPRKLGARCDTRRRGSGAFGSQLFQRNNPASGPQAGRLRGQIDMRIDQELMGPPVE
jgi:hypothetical protein